MTVSEVQSVGRQRPVVAPELSQAAAAPCSAARYGLHGAALHSVIGRRLPAQRWMPGS